MKTGRTFDFSITLSADDNHVLEEAARLLGKDVDALVADQVGKPMQIALGRLIIELRATLNLFGGPKILRSKGAK